MQDFMEIIGIITAVLLGLAGLLRAFNLLIKKLPVTANNLRELFSKGGWKRNRIKINGPLDDSDH